MESISPPQREVKVEVSCNEQKSIIKTWIFFYLISVILFCLSIYYAEKSKTEKNGETKVKDTTIYCILTILLIYYVFILFIAKCMHFLQYELNLNRDKRTIFTLLVLIFTTFLLTPVFSLVTKPEREIFGKDNKNIQNYNVTLYSFFTFGFMFLVFTDL